MPDALDLLLTRRSIPSINLGGPGPDAEQIRTLLTIGARVPDHGKLAPFRYIVFEGEARKDAGEALCGLRLAREPGLDAAQQEQERTRLSRAPLVIGVVSTAAPHPKIPVWEQELCAGAVCMNLVTAAHAMGFVSQWLTEWYAHDAEAAALLGVREGERFAGFIHIGTPTEPPFERPRPDIDTLTTHWSKD